MDGLILNGDVQSGDWPILNGIGGGELIINGNSFNETPYSFTVVTAGVDTFALPVEATGTYNCLVKWGDGSYDYIKAHDDAAVTHTYAAAGTYTVSITGTITGWRFNNGGDCALYYETKSWGPLRLGNSGAYFYGCVNHTCAATDILDLTGTANMASAFRDNTSLVEIPSINSWNWSGVSGSCYGLFYGDSLFNQNLNLNTSSVTGMVRLLSLCTAFNGSLVLDTSAVTDMQLMLDRATSFDQDLSGLDITSLVNAIDFLFGVTLSVANYNALILSWSAQVPSGAYAFHGGNSKYTGGGAVATARAAWVTKGWTLTDAGVA